MSTMNYLWTICSHPAFANQSIKAKVLIKVTKNGGLGDTEIGLDKHWYFVGRMASQIIGNLNVWSTACPGKQKQAS